jgi:hypothetical protein
MIVSSFIIQANVIMIINYDRKTFIAQATGDGMKWNAIEQVALNKSSLLLMTILQNTQTLQVFTQIIKTESFYKSY